MIPAAAAAVRRCHAHCLLTSDMSSAYLYAVLLAQYTNPKEGVRRGCDNSHEETRPCQCQMQQQCVLLTEPWQGELPN